MGWERFYKVKYTTQDEAQYLVDIYQDASALGHDMQATLQPVFVDYLNQVIDQEWPNMEKMSIFEKGDALVDTIWNLYYTYTPTTPKQTIWYTETIRKLDKFALARLTRIFNNANSVGNLRWILLIGGGLFLLSIPCFFKIDLLFFKFFLVFFLANIIAFLLFIIFSLDHPFTGHVEITPQALVYARQAIQAG